MFQPNKQQELALSVLTKYSEFGALVEVLQGARQDLTDLRVDVKLMIGKEVSPESEMTGRLLADSILERVLTDLKFLGTKKPTKDTTYE